jgi:flavin-binding protein dodecin
VVWDSGEAAEAAVARAAESPVCFRYFPLMEGAGHNEPGTDVEHYEAVRTYLSIVTEMIAT